MKETGSGGLRTKPLQLFLLKISLIVDGGYLAEKTLNKRELRSVLDLPNVLITKR